MRLIITFFWVILTSIVMGQDRMKELKDLINRADPGWPIVKEWIDRASNKVEVLPKDSIRADSALFQSQVTTRSPMGAIIYETGGILVDNGWIRILGSGSKDLTEVSWIGQGKVI